MKGNSRQTEDRRRLFQSAGLAAVVYIILIFSFSLYFYSHRQQVQPFGASAVYLELMQVSQAPTRAPASNPGGSTPMRNESRNTQTASTAAAAGQNRRPQTQSKPAAAVPTEEAAPAEEWNDDFFSDVDFGERGEISAANTESTVSASDVSDTVLSSSDYSRLDSALNRTPAAGNTAGGEVVSSKATAASGLGTEESVSVIDMEGLTDSRKLLAMTDPDFSGVDTAGRSRFSFVISFDLNADGTVTRVYVTESSGSALADRRMEQALRQWRFASVPGGTTVRVRLKYYVRVR